MIRALLDLSVSRLAEGMDVISVTFTTRGEKHIEMKPRKEIPADQEWRRTQKDAVPTIARLCREGRLTLCRSVEISLETMKGKYRGGNVVGDPLAGIELVHVPSAVDRSKFQQIDLEEFIEKKNVVEFCKLLPHLDPSIPGLIEMLTESEVTNLRNRERFRTLCAALAESQYPDALHLWTAEVNRLDYFLTADRKFINVMRETARVELTTKPIAPRELLDELGIPVD